MIFVGIAAAFATLIGLFANTGRMTFLWLRPFCKNINPLVYGVVYALVVILILAAFVASRVPGSGIPRVIFRIGHCALGFLAYLVIIVNAAALLLFLGKLFHIVPSPAPQIVLSITGAFCTVLVIGLSVYGIVHAGTIYTRQYTVQLGEKQDEMDSLQITLVSDIHAGYFIEETHLAKIVAAVNKTNPEVVCFSGDIFDGDITSLSNKENLQTLFRGIESRYGMFACLGNHDAGAGYEQMLTFLAESGIQVLQDETVEIDNRILLAGRKDSSPIGGQGDTRKSILELPESNTLPVIVLDHQPGNIGEYGAEVDLILSGHTHQGQIFPFNLITNAIFDVDYGYYRIGDHGPQVIVTSGAGTWGPPQRVGTENEIVVITLLFPKANKLSRAD